LGLKKKEKEMTYKTVPREMTRKRFHMLLEPLGGRTRECPEKKKGTNPLLQPRKKKKGGEICGSRRPDWEKEGPEEAANA